MATLAEEEKNLSLRVNNKEWECGAGGGGSTLISKS